MSLALLPPPPRCPSGVRTPLRHRKAVHELMFPITSPASLTPLALALSLTVNSGVRSVITAVVPAHRVRPLAAGGADRASDLAEAVECSRQAPSRTGSAAIVPFCQTNARAAPLESAAIVPFCQTKRPRRADHLSRIVDVICGRALHCPQRPKIGQRVGAGRHRRPLTLVGQERGQGERRGSRHSPRTRNGIPS